MRYLTHSALTSATSATTALESQKRGVEHPRQEGDVADNEGAANPHSNAYVADVADKTAENGRPRTLEDALLDEDRAEQLRVSVNGEWADPNQSLPANAIVWDYTNRSPQPGTKP